MASKISRHKAREQAFIVLFEEMFNKEPINELIVEAECSLDVVFDDYAKKIAVSVIEKRDELDGLFQDHLKQWSISRISKVSLTILRIAVLEMFFHNEVPDNVAINEAVELMKEYADKKDASFVNGVLGSVYKMKESKKENQKLNKED